MKRICVLFLVSLLVISCKTEPEKPQLPPNQYEVRVNAPGVYNGIRAHLNTLNQRRQPVPVDTAMFVNESAVFSGKVLGPQYILLTVNGVRGQYQFVLEPGITEIDFYTDSIYATRINGGPNNDMDKVFTQEYDERRKQLRAARDRAIRLSKSADTTGLKELQQIERDLAEEIKLFNHDFIDAHPDSDYSLLLLESMIVAREQNLERFKSSYKTLEPLFSKSQSNQLRADNIRSFMAQLEAQAATEVGKIAPDFSAPTPDGSMLSLSDIKGKATIIDFWAAWCGPCRRENPNVVKVYEKYHDKGLEIIGVSLDRPGQKQRWLDAIEKDGLPWHQVSNLQYFNDPVARLYNVTAIPATFILDEEGKIVAKKLRGKQLEDQIASMLD